MSAKVEAASEALWARSSVLMRVVSLLIRACAALERLAAREMSFPLMTHLCAAHVVVVETSSDVLSAKKCERLVAICCVLLGSVKRELSSLQIWDLDWVVGKVIVMEMGLWSDNTMGSIEAFVR